MRLAELHHDGLFDFASGDWVNAMSVSMIRNVFRV